MVNEDISLVYINMSFVIISTGNEDLIIVRESYHTHVIGFCEGCNKGIAEDIFTGVLIDTLKTSCDITLLAFLFIIHKVSYITGLASHSIRTTKTSCNVAWPAFFFVQKVAYVARTTILKVLTYDTSTDIT